MHVELMMYFAIENDIIFMGLMQKHVHFHTQ